MSAQDPVVAWNWEDTEVRATGAQPLETALAASLVVGVAESVAHIVRGQVNPLFALLPLGVWLSLGVIAGLAAMLFGTRVERPLALSLAVGGAALAGAAVIVSRFQNHFLAAAAFSLAVVGTFPLAAWSRLVLREQLSSKSPWSRGLATGTPLILMAATLLLVVRPRGAQWVGLLPFGIWFASFLVLSRRSSSPLPRSGWRGTHARYVGVLILIVACFSILRSSAHRIDVRAALRDLWVTALFAPVPASANHRNNARPDPATSAVKSAGRTERVVAAAATIPSATRTSNPASPTRPPPVNFVLITIDALRADHLSAHGYNRMTSPHIDEFAASATLFERAFSAATLTRDSIPAILTGRTPSAIDRGLGQWPVFLSSNVTIADHLSEVGYQNFGYLTHQYFDASNGFGRNFKVWDTDLAQRDDRIVSRGTEAKPLTDRVVTALDNAVRGPFFLWVHYMEPHHNYIAHPGFSSFGESRIDRYDGEILFVDSQIGRLLAALKARADWNRTAVFITSDHGEAFNEHGYFWHGMSLYNDQIHVPLVARIPGVPARRVATPVSTLDIAATMRALAHLPKDESSWGESLIALAKAQATARAPVVSEMIEDEKRKPIQAVIADAWKYIRYGSTGAEQLFDLSTDFGERRSVARAHPEKLLEMRAHWRRWRERLDRFAKGKAGGNPQ